MRYDRRKTVSPVVDAFAGATKKRFRCMRLRAKLTIAAAVILCSLALVAVDQFVDPEPFVTGDFALDVLDRTLTLGLVAVIAVLAGGMAALGRDAARIRADLGRVAGESEAWRSRSRRLLEGLSEAVGAQFAEWGLTPAEAEIAGLMLKGVRMREIATLRGTSETTIRQQAQGIYRKSGLANRSELSAYFLEDLFTIAEDGEWQAPEPKARH